MPKLSVIIATRNRNKLLNKTLLSLTGQTFKINFEVLVCDDGGNSNTGQIVNQYAKMLDIRYYKCPDKGDYCWAQAKNLGAHKARAKFLLFMDDDILMYPDTIKRMYRWISFLPYRKNKYFVTPHERFYIKDNIPDHLVIDNFEELKKYHLNNYINTVCIGCTGLIHKELFMKTGCFDEILFKGLQLGDIDFQKRLNAFYNIKNKVLPIMVFHLDNDYYRDTRNKKAINRKFIARQLIREKLFLMGFKNISFDHKPTKNHDRFSKDHFDNLINNKYKIDQISYILRKRMHLYDNIQNYWNINFKKNKY